MEASAVKVKPMLEFSVFIVDTNSYENVTIFPSVPVVRVVIKLQYLLLSISVTSFVISHPGLEFNNVNLVKKK